jgi:hypothetical protein
MSCYDRESRFAAWRALTAPRRVAPGVGILPLRQHDESGGTGDGQRVGKFTA